MKSLSYPMAKPGNRYEETVVAETMMSPLVFLSRVRPLEIDEASRDNIDDLKRLILSGHPLDPLNIRKNGAEDGRHRAHAAYELGIEWVPVIDEQPANEVTFRSLSLTRSSENRTTENLTQSASQALQWLEGEKFKTSLSLKNN